MKEYAVKETTSERAKRETINLVNRHGITVESVEINYNFNIGLKDFEDPTTYPVVFTGKENGEAIKIRVTSLTAGYNGTGPNYLCDLLQELGFKFNPDDILTKNKGNSYGDIKLLYVK